MEGRKYLAGEVIVPRAQRARFRHPLRGTGLARKLRRARRYAQATLLAWRHNSTLPAGAPVIQFYPVRPSPKTSIVRLCSRLRLRIGFDPAGPGTVFAWDDGHLFSPAAAARLPDGAINGRCLDVSKSHIDRAWEDVAGYGVEIDPLSYHGPLVAKTELNGNHDGELLMGPLSRREPGIVYQRLVETLAEDGRIHVMRPVIMADRIPFAFEAWRQPPQWFHGGVTLGPSDPAQLFSPVEIEQLLRFAATLGLDYGELDVLRDRADGRIYVIDANRTPLRPLTMPPECDAAVYGAMADAFAEFLVARGVRV
jgi:hypothetical protein